MKKLLVILVAILGSAGARAQTFRLGDEGKVTIYADPTAWTAKFDDLSNHFELIIRPKGTAKATATITFTTTDDDSYNTKEKLRARLIERYSELGEQSVEGKVVPNVLSIKNGIGYAADFTDSDLVGKPAEKDNYKIVTVGLFRLAKGVYGTITILADSFSDNAYQDLLGVVEGMEFAAGPPPPSAPAAPAKPAASPPAKAPSAGETPSVPRQIESLAR